MSFKFKHPIIKKKSNLRYSADLAMSKSSCGSLIKSSEERPHLEQSQL